MERTKNINIRCTIHEKHYTLLVRLALFNKVNDYFLLYTLPYEAHNASEYAWKLGFKNAFTFLAFT